MTQEIEIIIDEPIVLTLGAQQSLGPQGETGPQGEQGPQGETGATGATGPQGEQGIQGIQGEKGDTGDTGLTGPKGDTGVSGYTPVKGIDYFDGSKGDKGDTGNTGPQGEQGPPGAKGEKGDTGPQGIQGEKGDTGLTGPKGDTGLQGPKGDTGVGVAAGGTTGQFLIKKSNTDYDTEWAAETDPTVPAWAKQPTKPSYSKSEIGLGNVDNTSDANKPVSTAVQNELNLKANTLDLSDVATTGSYNDLSDKPTIPTVPVQSVSGKTGDVILVKADVGLGNVNNTSDLDKPVSTATQTALNAKVDSSLLPAAVKTNETLTSINDLSLSGNVLTISYTGENGVVQTKNIDLSSLTTTDVKVSNANYNASTNVITITNSDSTFFTIDLSEFSIISTTDANGVTTLVQEGITKATLSKVGQTGEYVDLLNKPTLGTASAQNSTAFATAAQGVKADTALQTETDPTVPAWAKQPLKPSYNKSEIGLGDVDNTSDANKPVSTATQTALNNKANSSQVLTDVPAGALFTDTTYSNATTSVSGLMSSADKTKLNGIAANANNYTHPTGAGNNHIPTGGAANQVLKYSASGVAVWGTDNDTIYTHPANHPASIITQDASNRFVTDSEKATWNAKGTSNLALGTTSVTAYRGDFGNTAYNHSQAAHAPSNAQKNSDILKSEVEAVLTGDITSHSHSFANITNKPATFTPSPHTHTIAEVTNLQTALDGKQPTGAYLTSYTETDPVFNAHTAKNITNGTGLLKNNGSGTWTYDNSTYLTANQTITLSGDVTGSGATSINTTVGKILNTTIPALSAGYLHYNGSAFVWDTPSGGSSLTINNNVDNRLLTANGGTSSIDAESGLTWGGNTLQVTGNIFVNTAINISIGYFSGYAGIWFGVGGSESLTNYSFLRALGDGTMLNTPVGEYFAFRVGNDYTNQLTFNANKNLLVGYAYNESDSGYRLKVNGNTLINGTVQSTSFIRTSGLSTEFLKADGSVDSSTYLTSYTETDPTVPSHVKSITTTNISDWNASTKASIIHSKVIGFVSPTNAENQTMWKTPQAITIQSVSLVVSGTSPSVTYTLRYGSSRGTTAGYIVASSTRTTTGDATLTTTSIPAGSYIWVQTSATSGTVNEFSVQVDFKFN